MPDCTMTADLVPHVAAHLLEQHGLAARGWTFGWDNARRRAGCCRYRDKRITLSRHYVERNVADRPGDVLDTILHEIAHALAGHAAGHGDAWRAVCARIGAEPKRCYDSEVIDMPAGKWRADCPGCAKVYRRHKKLRDNMWSYCRPCGKEAGRLTFRCTEPTPAAPPPTDPLNDTATIPAPRRLRGT